MKNETASKKPTFVRLELTPEPRTQLRARTGVDASDVRLTDRELEERIVPRGWIQVESVGMPIYR